MGDRFFILNTMLGVSERFSLQSLQLQGETTLFRCDSRGECELWRGGLEELSSGEFHCRSGGRMRDRCVGPAGNRGIGVTASTE